MRSHEIKGESVRIAKFGMALRETVVAKTDAMLFMEGGMLLAATKGTSKSMDSTHTNFKPCKVPPICEHIIYSKTHCKCSK